MYGRRAARARGEQEEQRVGHRHRDVGDRRARERRERRGVARGLDVEDAIGGHAEVEALEQRAVTRLGDDPLAVRVAHVARELRAAPRRVDPDDHAAGERRRSEPERELWDVLEQHADVERTFRARGEQERGALRARGHPLAVAPVVIPEAQRDVVVVGARNDPVAKRSELHRRHRTPST